MYTNLKARIVTNTEGRYFNINKRIKQGDLLSATLISAALEEILRRLNWENEGIKINGKILDNLRFVDDVELIENSIQLLEEMIDKLSEEEEAELTINRREYKIIGIKWEPQRD